MIRESSCVQPGHVFLFFKLHLSYLSSDSHITAAPCPQAILCLDVKPYTCPASEAFKHVYTIMSYLCNMQIIILCVIISAIFIITTFQFTGWVCKNYRDKEIKSLSDMKRSHRHAATEHASCLRLPQDTIRFRVISRHFDTHQCEI